MLKKIMRFAFIFMMASALQVKAQNISQDSTHSKWFIGSTLLLLGNLDNTNNPEFVQVNIGYRLTPNNAVSFEFKRSIYSWPLGIPWGPSFDAPGLNYPGHVRILAPTLAYQQFWWKGFYTSVHALNAFEKYVDENDRKIGNGYTLYLTYRLGYQIKFFNSRLFFEPSIGFTHWPIRNNVPESFRSVERQWPNYFAWEPGLHFGFNF